jgi:hypothetical protein
MIRKATDGQTECDAYDDDGNQEPPLVSHLVECMPPRPRFLARRDLESSACDRKMPHQIRISAATSRSCAGESG